MTCAHPQIDIDDEVVDAELAVLLPLIWERGIKTRQACQGDVNRHPLPSPAYIICPRIEDAAEFLVHVAHITDYKLGDNIALTIRHPLDDIQGQPEGKVAWVPEMTAFIVKSWS